MDDKETSENISEKLRRADLRERLIAGYLANAEADALLAEVWRSVKEEAWLKFVDKLS